MRGIRERLTYANVMSTIAVLIAIGGGTAFAASQLGRNSVKSRNIAPGAVRPSDIANGAVKRLKIASGAVDGSKLANGSVDDSKISASLKSKLNGIEGGGLIRVVASGANQTESPEVPLMSRGPFRIYAKCWIGGATVYSQVYAATTQTGSMAIGTLGTFVGQPGYLNPDSMESQRRFATATTGVNGAVTLTGGVTLIHGSNAIQFGVNGAVKGANPASDADNYGGTGARCVYSPLLIQPAG